MGKYYKKKANGDYEEFDSEYDSWGCLTKIKAWTALIILGLILNFFISKCS